MGFSTVPDWGCFCFLFTPSLSVTSDCSQMLSGVVLNVQRLKMATGEPDVPPLQGRARFRELLLGEQPCQSEDRYGIHIVLAMARHGIDILSITWKFHTRASSQMSKCKYMKASMDPNTQWFAISWFHHLCNSLLMVVVVVLIAIQKTFANYYSYGIRSNNPVKFTQGHIFDNGFISKIH